MNSPTAADQTNLPRGTAWTLTTGVAVFIAILATVYTYVIPRLGQELVSTTASLEFRESTAEPRDAWPKTKLPDGTTRFVSGHSTFRARDFKSFKNDYKSDPPEIILILSAAGRSRLQNFRSHRGFSTFVVMLHGKPLTEVAPAAWSDTDVKLSLRGMSTSDANEVLARLTE
jgi:hypothetical protein